MPLHPECSTPPTLRFDYIFDPLCGWCYASAPALAALARAWPGRLALRPSGLFADAGARDLTPDWARHAWVNDQRIAAMTGQVFSTAYHDQVLQGAAKRFDSGPLNRALTAVRALDAALEPQVLARLQTARYVQGLDTASAAVVAQVTAQALQEAGHTLNADAFAQRLHSDAALAQATQARTQATQALMRERGVRGVPQLLVSVDGAVRSVDSAALYQGAEHLIDAITALACPESLTQPAGAFA